MSEDFFFPADETSGFHAYGRMDEPADSLADPDVLSEDIDPAKGHVEIVRAILSSLVTERAATILADRTDLGFWSPETSPVRTWAAQDDAVLRSTRILKAGYRDHAARRAAAASKKPLKLSMQQEYGETDKMVIRGLDSDLGDWRQYTEVHYFKAESKRDRVVTLDPGGYLVRGGRRLPDGQYGWVLSYADRELFVFDPDVYTQVKFEYDRNLQRLTDKVEKLAEKQPDPAAMQRARLAGYQAIRHPSHVAGEAVYGAGMLSVQGGLIKLLDDESGHYRPLLQNTGAAAAILRRKRFFADGARIELIGAKTERGAGKSYLPADAPRMSLLLDQMSVLVRAEASEQTARKKRDVLAKLTTHLSKVKEEYDRDAKEAQGTGKGTAKLWPSAMELAQEAVDALSEGEILTDEGKRAVTLVASTAGLQVGVGGPGSEASDNADGEGDDEGDDAVSSSLADDDEDADDAESSSSEEGFGGTGGDTPPASAPVTLADVDLAAVDKRNRANLKALTDRGQISFIQSADGLVLIGDGHDWTAVRYMGEAGHKSGTLRIRKGRLTSAGRLVVTNASDTKAFKAAIARISDKTCVFQ
jgi:hypothetical protein